MTRKSQRHLGARSTRLPSAGPNTASNAYRGPVHVQGDNDRQILSIALASALEFTLAADEKNVKPTPGAPLASGTYSQVFDSNDVTGLSDFTDAASLWLEYRVLGMELKYIPQWKDFVGTTVSGNSGPLDPLVIAPFHGDATAFTTLGLAINHAGAHPMAANDAHRVAVRMNGADEAIWINSSNASPTVRFGFKTWLYSAGTAGTYKFGTFIITYLLEFRQRASSSVAKARLLLAVGSSADDDEKNNVSLDKVEYVTVTSTALQQAAPVLRRAEPPSPSVAVPSLLLGKRR